jgi:prepilin-type N-terminal cleavage/methylation domain-containing protein/prepilin-type processing-associated H-X9-DG protein
MRYPGSFPGAPRRRSRRAFTLIELLVVIAIIAILAAILFPVFAQARNKARQVGCLSNMKQIGIGLQMYAQDYDETLPVANNKHWYSNNHQGGGNLIFADGHAKYRSLFSIHSGDFGLTPDRAPNPTDSKACDPALKRAF